jgi:tripartite-type tricarboxylate transporter receptor subunit TctC
LGAAAVARAPADGYTILLGGGGAMVINPVASSRPPYDPIRDFAPIALVVVHAFALAVHPSAPARTLTEFVDHVRRNPGRMSYGSAGVGSVNHLTGELLKSLAGIPDLVHVPYRGAGPAITDLISGQIPFAIPAMSVSVLELHRAGKLRLLAITSPQRLAGAPEIPTAVEAGIAGMVSQNLVGLFAPAGTPPAIIEQIARATAAALAEPKYQQQLIATGFEPALDSSPDKMQRIVQDEIARWTPVIRAIGLKLD